MAHGHRHGHRGGHKFDPANIDRLRDPERRRYLDPDLIWEHLQNGPTTTIVDIGAGIGFFAIPFAEKLPGGTVHACDTSAEMLDHLREHLRRAGVTNVVPLRVEEVKVPLPDGVADLVFMANMHHEFDHPDASLAECRRLLRPGGRVAIIDWKPEPTPHGPPVEVRIPPATVQDQLARAGFSAIQSHDVLPYHYFLTASRA